MKHISYDVGNFLLMKLIFRQVNIIFGEGQGVRMFKRKMLQSNFTTSDKLKSQLN